MKTFPEIIDSVHSASTALGVTVSRDDVVFIVASFLECFADAPVDGKPAVQTGD